MNSGILRIGFKNFFESGGGFLVLLKLHETTPQAEISVLDIAGFRFQEFFVLRCGFGEIPRFLVDFPEIVGNGFVLGRRGCD